jgi:hypothetical protein
VPFLRAVKGDHKCCLGLDCSHSGEQCGTISPSGLYVAPEQVRSPEEDFVGEIVLMFIASECWDQ